MEYVCVINCVRSAAGAEETHHLLVVSESYSSQARISIDVNLTCEKSHRKVELFPLMFVALRLEWHSRMTCRCT
jgi:hypothetical protein